eukprot:gene41323-55894_t
MREMLAYPLRRSPMLPLLLALAAVQPAVATDNHATLLAQSDAIDANFSAVRAKQVQVSYLALADRARALGDLAVANALSAKAAYALVIQGRNDEAAQALGVAGEIGSLEVGCTADLAVWDWGVGPLATHRDGLAKDLHERLFAWMTLGDERNLVATHVAGVPVFERA